MGVWVTDGDGRGVFKYPIENSIGVSSTDVFLAPAYDLYGEAAEVFSESASAHLYVIGTRPRLSMDAARLVIEPNYIRGTWLNADEDEITVWSAVDVDPDGCRFADDGAALEFTADGEVTEEIPISTLLARALSVPNPLSPEALDWVHANFLDFTVEYVGQAFGADGERTSIRRLKEHSTFQEILARLDRGPQDRQTWVMMIAFNQQTNSMVVGPWSEEGLTDGALVSALRRFDARLDADQATTIAEGAMIRYFAPRYNRDYKETFPDASHEKYRQPIDLDVNSLSFGLDVRSTCCRVGSATKPPQFGHSAFFPLHSRKRRRAILDIFEDLSGVIVPNPADMRASSGGGG